MKNLTIYIGIEFNEEPYPVLFKKLEGLSLTKKELIAKGKELSKGSYKLLYLAGFDKTGNIKVAHDFQNGDWCGELSLEYLKYIVL